MTPQPPMAPQPRIFDGRSLGIACWFTSLAILSSIVVAYSVRPGEAGAVGASWPEASGIERVEAPTVLVFCHERCPCTRATISELARARTSAPAGARFIAVLFDPPSGEASGSPRIDLADLGPDVEVVADPDRRECRAFGVETSGHVVAYDRTGQLLFSGGVTAGRGHEGSNAGRTSLVRALHRATGDASPNSANSNTDVIAVRHAVWGCPIFGDSDCTDSGGTDFGSTKSGCSATECSGCEVEGAPAAALDSAGS